MDSTPDEPVPSPDESGDVAAAPEPVVPPAGAEPVVPPVGPGVPALPPPDYPPAWQGPAGASAPGPNGYAPGAWTPPAAARNGLSFGAGLGIGTAIGVVAHLIGVGLMFASLEPLSGFGGVFGLLWPFVLIALAAGVMMFFKATRSYATGILIIAAAMWLVIIGPCILLITSLGG